MQSRLLLALFFVVVLTVLLGYVPSTEAASTERPYQFGFTIEKQQHRQEKKDERGIVMGEFGFITADGIYHVTVYATDEEGKFRILAMRSYPYEENPKTIEMVVRPKPQPTTPKAIATPATTAKPKPFEKHNFSVQGCSGCFLKNNAPTTTTTTRKPEDKKYDISLLSRPLAPEQAPVIGKQIVANVLPQVIQEVQQVETKLKQTATNVPKVTAIVDTAIAQQITPLASKPVAGFSTNANPQKAQGSQTTQQNLPQHTTQTQQKPQFAPPKPLETLSTNANHLSPVVAPNLASSAPPSSTVGGSKAKTPTTSAFGNAPQVPAKTGTNVFSKPASSQSSGGAKGSPAGGIPTPSTKITAPAIGGGKGAANQPSANTGSNSGSSGGNNGFVGNNKFGGNSGSSAASGSKAGSAAGFGGGSTGNKAATSGASGSKAATGGSTGSKPAFGGGSTGSKTVSAAVGEAGDLYRFKYLLDYNGHRETGSHSGNKEGSFYAIGDDNVERTIEYIANEFGYQPRVRFRKLDAPMQAKENTLKDYEFVWFKKQ
uniref:Protein lethal(3)malignant blood neoplasm 1 n=1 Tax=Zeugodacus cucurbitae TaxID=28588 RepID=A0A0A1WMZ4_ZEUCU